MGNFLAGGHSSDVSVKVDYDNPIVRKIIKAKEDMTGWERVEMVFSKNQYDELSPEMERIKDATLISCLVGAGMGGFGRSRIAYMDFFRQNVSTVYETPLQAKKALQDKVVLGMGSGAFRIGWRLAAFTFMYMTGSTAIAAYRGKAGIIDQVGGAGIAGFIYKFRDGPKAAISGSVFGTLLGLVAGILTVGVVKLTGADLETVNMQYYHRLAKRQEKEHAAMVELRNEAWELKDLGQLHESLLVTMASENSEGSALPDQSTGTHSHRVELKLQGDSPEESNSTPGPVTPAIASAISTDQTNS